MEVFENFKGNVFSTVSQQLDALAAAKGLTIVVWREGIPRLEADPASITVMINNDDDQIITKIIPPGE